MPSEKHYLAFVDSIATSPTVRLDLSGGTRGPFNLRGESRFDPPPLKRSIPSTLLADGGTPTNAAYDNRVCVLKLGIMDGGEFKAPDPAASAIQLLIRELDRPSNILRLQAGTSTPVFFRTYRSGPDAIDFDPITREVNVTLLAEPFALGLEEVLSPVVVTNNPAAASNGMFVDIAAPKGDTDAPLTVTFTNGNSGLGGTGRIRSALAMRRRGTPSSTPFFLQAEAMTMSIADTTIQANSALMSGAGSNFTRTTFATLATMTNRLQTTTKFPTSASTDARGQYRVFARVRQNTATDVIDMRLLYANATYQFTGDTVRLPPDVGPSAPTIKYVDLGMMPIPVGFDPVYDGLSGVELATEGVYLTVQAQRVSGAGSLDIDVLLFVPAEDRLELIMWPALQAFSTDAWVADGGPRPTAYCLNNSSQLTSTEAIGIAGGGMMITPGRANRLFFIKDVGTGTAQTGAGNVITETNTLTLSYFPRYLGGFRPVAT